MLWRDVQTHEGHHPPFTELPNSGVLAKLPAMVILAVGAVQGDSQHVTLDQAALDAVQRAARRRANRTRRW